METDNHYNCVYLLTNTLNGLKYVGQTVNLNERLREHVKDSKTRTSHIAKAIKENGLDIFQVDILEENLTGKEEMYKYEMEYIKKYRTNEIEYGYNIQFGTTQTGITAETRKEYLKQYCNLSHVKQRNSEYRQTHKEMYRAADRKRNKTEHRREYKREYRRLIRLKLKQEREAQRNKGQLTIEQFTATQT